FGDSLRAVGGLGDLSASDSSTRLGDALAALAAEMRGRELSQVVVVSDGRSNAGREVPAALTIPPGRRVPLNTIAAGDPSPPPEARIAGVTAPEVALVGDTVTLEVSVAARGYPGAPSTVTLTDGGSHAELAREEFTLADAPGATQQVVRISFVPETEG